jgi:hypothetical protein
MAQEWTPPPAAGPTEKVPNYLVLSIISAFCCLPLGIVGIVFAAQVNGKLAAGDLPGALAASKKAKMFSFIAIGLAILLWGCYLIFWLVIGGISMMGTR